MRFRQGTLSWNLPAVRFPLWQGHPLYRGNRGALWRCGGIHTVSDELDRLAGLEPRHVDITPCSITAKDKM
jgi:hypothetical protein